MDTSAERIYMESVRGCMHRMLRAVNVEKQSRGPNAIFAEMRDRSITPRYAVLAPPMEGAGIGFE